MPEIQACVNAAFAPVMTGDAVTLQADYVPLVAVPAGDQGAAVGDRAAGAGALRRAQSLGDQDRAVAARRRRRVHRLAGQRERLEGRRASARQAQDICILFRRFLSFGEDITQPYVRALEARGVRHVLVGGKSFHDREEVETLRAALSAIEWPDDELSVFATLRGALFAVGDEELLEWKQRFGVFHPFRHSGCAPPSDVQREPPDLRHLRPIADSLRVLQHLHRRRNYRPVAETIQDLLDATRAHVGIVLRSAGEQALANVLHVAELAREYEAGGGLSFRGFVDELRDAAEHAQAAEAPILEEGSDGVRMMTVHKAKGLEFPIVILADLTCKLSRAEAGRWLDPDEQPVRAEDRRLGADRSAAPRRGGSGARSRRVASA